MSTEPHVEFLVEPFVEGRPGPHVDAAIDAFAAKGLNVEMGPFSSSSAGDIDAIAEAVGAMIRSSMKAGASAIRIQVGARREDLDAVGSLKNALNDMIRAAERELGADAGDWDRTQKQAAVRMLNDRGAFLLRGAVDDIAHVLGVSRITIYNYLNALS
ncbi:MAG: DNA-binding protein [Acidimicrobiales bacterium]|nr:DNA-binding protein [Acidimicrobiales bacterium]